MNIHEDECNTGNFIKDLLPSLRVFHARLYACHTQFFFRPAGEPASQQASCLSAQYKRAVLYEGPFCYMRIILVS